MTALAAIHVARKQLGLDDETARDLYEQATGKRSLRAMTPAEQGAVVAALKQRGFKPSLGGRRKALEGRFAKKLQALWIAGWNLGIVRNRDDAALLAFVKRQTGVDHTRFLHHPEDAAKAIEALKSWLAREGGVDWTVDRTQSAFTQMSGYRIAIAQWRKLEGKAALDRQDWNRFLRVARDAGLIVTGGLDDLRESAWQPVMNELGKRIRAAQEQ